MLTICLLVSLSFLSTATAESSDSFADLVAFHANRVRDRRNVNDKNMSAVGVGGFWDEDHVLKMLGIEDADSVGSTSTDLQRNEVEVPSILTALYNKMKDPASNVVPQKCKIPGMKGNVVRVFRNKGRLLNQNQGRSVVELRFSVRNAFHSYEDVTEATLKISVPGFRKSNPDFWKLLMEDDKLPNPRYKYEIFLIDDVKAHESTKDVLTRDQNSELRIHQQKPLVSKSFISKFGNTSEERTIDVTILVKKWREIYLRTKTRKLLSAFLFITTDFHGATQCVPALTLIPRLIVTSHDRRQCPLQSSSYKTSLGTIAVVGDAKNRVKRASSYNGSNVRSEAILDQFRSVKLSELNVVEAKADETKRAAHSRSVRSTICKRHPLYLHFDDVGWGQWIIAPRGIQAYKCAGDCPFPLVGEMKGTNHAVLLNLMSSFDSKNRPSASCVPSTLSSLPLLYFDKNDVVVLRQYEDMVVQTCACR